MMQTIKDSRRSSRSSSRSRRRRDSTKHGEDITSAAAPPLSASPPLPFHARGQNFWAAASLSHDNDIVLNVTFGVEEAAIFTAEFLELRREDVRGMLTHAYGSYIVHGFPADEVRPISCKPHNMFLADGGGNGPCISTAQNATSPCRSYRVLQALP
jgi:hypothetical protein